MGLRIKLSAMMFLQYFVFGIWLPMLAQFLGDGPGGIKLDPRQVAWMFSLYGIGALIGPAIVGQLADRYFSTEHVLAFCHIVGGFLLIASGQQTSFWPLFILMLMYCNLYMPSMGLTNSITFKSMGEDAFPGIRLWGTIGWIAAGFFFAFYLESKENPALKSLFDLIGEPGARDCLRVSGAVSILYGLYCFALPHTPPSPAQPTDSLEKRSAFLESLALMKDTSFAVLTCVSALIGIMLAFYFACENDFLASIGTRPQHIGAYMTIGQIAELVVMLFVPLAVRKLGYKTTMLIGAAFWAARFGFSVIGSPWWLMIATIGLHGFCFGFFFVVAQMFVDSKASEDIKASAQSLLIFLIYGVGTVVGSLLTGEVRTYFNNDWHKIWAGPFVLTIICMILFAVFFHEKEIKAKTKKSDANELTDSLEPNF